MPFKRRSIKKQRSIRKKLSSRLSKKKYKISKAVLRGGSTLRNRPLPKRPSDDPIYSVIPKTDMDLLKQISDNQNKLISFFGLNDTKSNTESDFITQIKLIGTINMANAATDKADKADEGGYATPFSADEGVYATLGPAPPPRANREEFIGFGSGPVDI